jgi:hypothetical protein
LSWGFPLAQDPARSAQIIAYRDDLILNGSTNASLKFPVNPPFEAGSTGQSFSKE